jgi:hypothetical protein
MSRPVAIRQSDTVALDAGAGTAIEALHRSALSVTTRSAVRELGLARPDLADRRLTARRADHAGSESDVFLSIATRFTATDAVSRSRLLDAWAGIGPLSGALVKGAARSVKAYVDDLEEAM